MLNKKNLEKLINYLDDTKLIELASYDNLEKHEKVFEKVKQGVRNQRIKHTKLKQKQMMN